MLPKFVNFILEGAERFTFLDEACLNILTRFLNASEGELSSSSGCLLLFLCFVGEDVFLVVTIGSAYCLYFSIWNFFPDISFDSDHVFLILVVWNYLYFDLFLFPYFSKISLAPSARFPPWQTMFLKWGVQECLVCW